MLGLGLRLYNVVSATLARMQDTTFAKAVGRVLRAFPGTRIVGTKPVSKPSKPS